MTSVHLPRKRSTVGVKFWHFLCRIPHLDIRGNLHTLEIMDGAVSGSPTSIEMPCLI